MSGEGLPPIQSVPYPSSSSSAAASSTSDRRAGSSVRSAAAQMPTLPSCALYAMADTASHRTLVFQERQLFQ